jgi:hypothetical protein
MLLTLPPLLLLVLLLLVVRIQAAAHAFKRKADRSLQYSESSGDAATSSAVRPRRLRVPVQQAASHGISKAMQRL